MGTALAWLNQQSHCVAFAGLAMETPVRRRRTCKGLGFECEEPVSPSPRALKRRLSDLESFTPTKVRRPGVKEAAPEKLKEAKATSAEVLLDQVSAAETYPLVSRERECAVLDGFLQSSLAQGKGGCLYLSGGPGTGKTSSARGAARVWRAEHPETRVLEINCMENLQPSSIAGLLLRLIEAADSASGASTKPAVTSKSPMPSLVSAALSSLRRLGTSVILVVDEVDQLVRKPSHCTGEHSLDHLCSLPSQQGAPALAVVMIANAVDLLIRACRQQKACQSVLFEPYSAEQLRSIVKAQFQAAGEEGEMAEKALGRSGIELSVRRVAKHSGDCRHIVRLCEDGFAEASRQKEAVVNGEAVKKKVLQSDNDPLAEVKHFPLGHQILMGTLSQSERQDVPFLDLFQRYRAILTRLKQPTASKPQANAALAAMEQRGLLHLRKKRSKCRGNSELVVELVVSRKSLREELCRADPLLRQCFSE
ncbi:unnamed protein product [Effrenium voratum]|nr:unnamed protein product [Effrenium voratum]